MAGGRPTDYKPEYCETVQALGSKGYSLTEIASALDVVKQTIYSWQEAFPEFMDAMEKARLKSQAWWEKIGREHIVEHKDDDKINASLYSRSMGARFPDDWREKTDIKHEGGMSINVVSMIPSAPNSEPST